jgi:opacity protein-like surface antigen
MKTLARIALVSAVLAAVPANAAEVGIIVDKQFGKSQAIASLPGAKYDAVSPTGFGIRAGVSLIDLKVAELGLTATYHPKAEGDLVLAGTKLGKLGNEYVAIGAQVDWKFLVNLHAGVDLRSEKLTTDVAGVKDSTTTTRPWVKAGIGFSVPTPVVSPFFRLEVAVAATKEDKTDTPDNFRKAMAPEYQVGIYGGIRF